MSFIPIDVKKNCIAMANSGKTAREIYTEYFSKSYETAFTGFESMLKRWKKKTFADDAILETGNLSYGFTPYASTIQVGKDGQITQSWIKSKATDGLYLELINNIQNLPPFDLIEKIDKEPLNRMLEITFDDMHFGIADLDDYKQTLQDTINIISSNQYKEINLIIGEDLIHTDNFRGQTSNGTMIGEIDVPKAYNEALAFYYSIIVPALKHSEKVRVFYSMGNHSETLSWTIVQVLRVKFPQLVIDDSLEPRKIIRFEKIFIGVTHGDTIKGNLRDVKDLFVEENTSDYANAIVKEIHIGHFHALKETGDINGCIVRRLSTKDPTEKDPWSKKHGFTSAVKRFMLFEYSEDRLLTIHYV